jgi:hypothetical protein
VAVVDHGGILADQRDAAEQVANALARQPDPSLAARSDPWTLDRQLRQQIAQHEQVLAGRPPDRQEALTAAVAQAARAQAWLANMDAIAGHSNRQLEELGRLAGLSRRGRDQRRRLEDKLTGDTERATAARHTYDNAAARAAQLRRDQDTFEQFENAQGWRRDDLIRLHEDLDHHWAKVVTGCVRADDPLAFGIDKLRYARTTTLVDLGRLDAAIPADRSTEWDQTRRQFPEVLRARHDAEQNLAGRQAALQEAGRRRWGRHDQHAITAARASVAVAEEHLEQAAAAEQNLREQLDAVSQYQQQRQQAVAAAGPKQHELVTSLAQLDGALDLTRADRIHALVAEPPSHLVERLGSPPASPAGQAVWCHHALAVEALLDRNDGVIPPSTHSQRNVRARQDIALADRCLNTASHTSDPTEWAELAQQAAALRDELHRNVRVQAAINHRTAQPQQAQRHPSIDNLAAPRGPEFSL